MNGIVVISLLVVALAASEARMPNELSRFLGLESKGEEVAPSTIVGRVVDPVEEARVHLGTGEVQQYMPAPIEKVECFVEFQVTEKVPGRCTKLAGTIPACQAEKYIGINYNECS